MAVSMCEESFTSRCLQALLSRGAGRPFVRTRSPLGDVSVLSRQGAEGPVRAHPARWAGESAALAVGLLLGAQLRPPFCSLSSLPALERTGSSAGLCSVRLSGLPAVVSGLPGIYGLERESPPRAPLRSVALGTGTGGHRGLVFSSPWARGDDQGPVPRGGCSS